MVPIARKLGCFTVCIVAVAQAAAVDYSRNIQPIFARHCYSCHGALKQKSGLRLDTGAAVRIGSKDGPVISVSQPEASELLIRITSTNLNLRMPFEGDPLSAAQVAAIRSWIIAGTKSPAAEQPEVDLREHWAFKKVVRPAIPEMMDVAWAKNPIDAFIAQSHSKLGLGAQWSADKPTLLRRVYIDLLGIPPTREQLQAFLADDSPEAYEKVVDHLLSLPQHGERWARHWMDVWRYSDWYGRRQVPDVWNSAPQVWRWRDWIVRSLNNGKGYDKMIMEMLAADELDPANDESTVATGYLVRNWYALNPNQWMRDNVEHTSKAFIGLTIHCAHCHDHKYDPITQEDYFNFRAFFEPIHVRQDRWPGEADPGPYQDYNYLSLRKVVKTGMVRVFDKSSDAKTWIYTGGDERNRQTNRPPAQPASPAFLGVTTQITQVELPPAVSYPGLRTFVQQEEIAAAQQSLAVAQTELVKTTNAMTVSKLDSARARLAAVQARIEADSVRYKLKPGDSNALAKAAHQAEGLAAAANAKEKLVAAEEALTKAANTKSGDAKKDEAAKQAAQKTVDDSKKTLAATETAKAESMGYTAFSSSYPAQSTGRRSTLARWIASGDNPLTARVAVNHIWLRHFHSPLVATVHDFGRFGARPSHPELIDWLAAEFVDSGWDMKHLHRLIVTSATYRMQSSHGTVGNRNAVLDPENRSYWRMNPGRMEAEVVRDSLLHLAGELDLKLGGMELENSEAVTSRRRSLYFSVYPEDGGKTDLGTVFDAPDPNDCYRRTKTVIPQQALALVNGKLAFNQGIAIARKIGATNPAADGDEAFVLAVFEQVLCRWPSNVELRHCMTFLNSQRDMFRVQPPASVPNGKSVDPALRAREGLVQSILNHNDFLTVR